MKFIKHIYAVSLLSASLFLLLGCNNDEETRLSDAVLASNASLTFEAQGNTDKIITVYADAAWETEIPEWVTVTPTSGIGTTDVTISVTDNMRDGAEDNPRKATLVFKGRTLASRAEVLIIQNGDKYFGSYFWSNSIDVMVLATLRLLGVRPTMENFKLMTVAKTVGVQIDESKLHDAMYDIYLTREIYNRIITEWNLEKQ